MQKDREQKKEQRQTMLFRKRKKAPIVKYSWDERFAREGRSNFAPPNKGMTDQTQAFNAWCEYPAMKTCSDIRKLPTNLNNPYMEVQEPLDSSGGYYKNEARRNLSMWERIKQTHFSKGEINPNMVADAINAVVYGLMTSRVKTIKACPAVKDILTQTLVVKCPTDIHFAKGKTKDMSTAMNPLEDVTKMKEEDRWHWTSPATHLTSNGDPWGEYHAKEQYCHGESSGLKDYTNIKMNTGILLDIPDHIVCIQHQPTFHKIDLPMQVIPGIFSYPLNKAAAVIPNFFIHKDQPDFILKKGDPLIYLTFSEPVKFEENEKGSDTLVRFAFDTPQLSWRNLSGKSRY